MSHSCQVAGRDDGAPVEGIELARSKQTASEYIERYDGEMRIILGELVENAGHINMWCGLGTGGHSRRP